MSAKAAVESVLEGGGLQTAEPVQREFFASDQPATIGEDVERTGKPGRPKGAVNKTTAQMIEFIQRTKGDPRIALARVMATSIDELRQTLGCNRLEAYDRWAQAVFWLLPYMAGKPALELAVKSTSTKLVLFAGMPGQPLALPPGGVVGLLEQAAEQARQEEGWNVPESVLIEGGSGEVESDDKSEA